MRGEAFGGVLSKPEPRAKGKRRAQRQRAVARRLCREAVYAREAMRCQRCGTLTKRPEDCTWGGDPDMAHVNEIVPRSLGGDPLDVTGEELCCQKCHFGGPSGAHAPTPERMRVLSRSADGTLRIAR